MAAGYSGTPLLKKLGVTAERSLLLVDAPPDVDAILGDLPVEPARGLPRGSSTFDLALLFVTRRADLERQLPRVAARLTLDGAVWVAWPKKASRVPTDVTEDTVREVALPQELVDTKVCAIDAVWSGLRLCLRVEARKRRDG